MDDINVHLRGRRHASAGNTLVPECNERSEPYYQTQIILLLSHAILLTSGLGDGFNLNHRRTEVLIIVFVLRTMVSTRTTSFSLVLRGSVVAPGCCRGRGLESWSHPDIDVLDRGKLPRTTRKNPLVIH